VKVNSFFSKECSQRYIPESLELINGKAHPLPVSSDWGKTVASILLLDSKEKALYAGSIFIKATTSRLGKKVNNFTPLYIHELQLIQEDEAYCITITDTFVNPIFVDCVNAIGDKVNLKFDTFIQDIPSTPYGFENLVDLESALIALLPDWNLESLKNLYAAEFDNSKYTEQVKGKRYNHKALYSNLILGIFNKPVGSRGVISELTKISEQAEAPKLLKKFFLGTSDKAISPKQRPIHVPASLSEAQKEVFYKKDANDISLVIGPPGTGKSYTIAALAIDVINNGESVLIVSKNNQAGKVVAKKIENDLGAKKVLVKAETQRYKRSLIAKLSKLTHGYSYSKTKPDLKAMKNDIKLFQTQIDKLLAELIATEKNEIKWGQFYFENKVSFFTTLKAKWIAYQKRRATPVWKLNQKIANKQKLKIDKLKQFVKYRYEDNLNRLLRLERPEFINLIEALQEQSGNALESIFDTINFKLILKALPAWVCNTQDISKILPLQKELFDVVIIDEASQCDIATVIPILYRAKKIVVVGDPNQLRHYSFLSDLRQTEIKAKYQLAQSIPNYRKMSLIDLTNKIVRSQNQVTFLDEHFRSKPDLIRFSNEKFYDGHLKLMRATPNAMADINNKLTIVEGKRDGKGINEAEAHAILGQVQNLIAIEAELDIFASGTIGILSPFQTQTKFIKSIIRANIKQDDIKKHNILIGTPYHFQGEERDIMLLSFTVDNQVHPSVYNYLNKEDVFNVSITRARNFQFVYASIDFKTNAKNHLLHQYLNDISKTPTDLKLSPTNETYDLFYQEVIEALSQLSINRTYKSTYVAGVKIDLAVVHNDKTYAIDLIGYPGELVSQFTPENLQMLQRMNRPIFFIPYSNWVLDKEKTINNLWAFLTK